LKIGHFSSPKMSNFQKPKHFMEKQLHETIMKIYRLVMKETFFIL